MKVIITYVGVFAVGVMVGFISNTYNVNHRHYAELTRFTLLLPTFSPGKTLKTILEEDNLQIFCIALAVYGEGRGETAEGMVSIAYTVDNRVLDPQFNHDACGVILEDWQFEPFFPGKHLTKYVHTAKQGGPTDIPAMNNKWKYQKILSIARDVYYHHIPDPTNGATHFWSPSVQKKLGRPSPEWATRLAYLGQFGTQKYYN